MQLFSNTSSFVIDHLHRIPKAILLLLVANIVAATFIFSVGGVFNDRIDADVYVAQIESTRAFFGAPLPPEHIPLDAWQSFKPFYGAVGGLLATFVDPYVALLLINLFFFVGLTLLSYLFLRELGFQTLFAVGGTLWIVFSYPMLKYGLALGTDISGWFFSMATIVLVLRAVRTDSVRLVFFASIIGFVGSLAKETGVIGLIFSGLFLLWHFRVWGIGKLAQWLAVLCIPVFVLQLILMATIFMSSGVTFVEWYTLNAEAHQDEYYKILYFAGVMASTFNMLLPLAFLGAGIAVARGDVLKRAWVTYYAPLLIAPLPILLWPVFISRVLFIQFIFFVPLALYAVQAISDRFAGRFKYLPYILLALPPLASTALFLLSGHGSLFVIFGNMLSLVYHSGT